MRSIFTIILLLFISAETLLGVEPALIKLASIKPALIDSLQESETESGASTLSTEDLIREASSIAGDLLGIDPVASVDSLLGEAKVAIDKLEESGNFIQKLTSEDMVTLPVGIKLEIGNITYIMAISEVKLTKDYTEIKVFVKINIPQIGTTGSPRELFFGAEHVKISHKGGIYEDAYLVLLGNQDIPFNGGNVVLRLKGGFDRETGESEKLTYVTIDCNGFKEMFIDGAVIFSRSLIVPVNSDNKTLGKGKVSADFKIAAGDWNDILAEVSLPRFQVASGDTINPADTVSNGFIFELNKAVLDFSDLRNSSSIVFPEGYDKYLIPGNEDAWRGVYINSLKIFLPEEFKTRNSKERISLEGYNLLIDGMGISGSVSANNILPLDDGSADSWKFSIDDFTASFRANQLVGAGFGGEILLPVNKSDDETLDYSALFSLEQKDYQLTATLRDELPLNIFKATATFAPESYIQLRVKNKSFKPRAQLTGTMSIGGDKTTETTETTETTKSTETTETAKSIETTETADSEDSDKDDASSAADFKGVRFQKLELQTESPYMKVEYMGYDGDVSLGKFPVTLSDIGLTASANSAALHFGVDVNLMKGAFGGGTDLTLFGKMDSTSGSHNWKYNGVKLNAIRIEADLGAIKLNGEINIKQNDPVYGDGFFGAIGADFNGIAVDASAWFGRKEFRYWYVDAYADLTGANLMIGATKVFGLGGGASSCMGRKPGVTLLDDGTSEDFKSNTPSGVSYIPNEENGLEFRSVIALALGNEAAFNAKVGFEMTFNKYNGINRVSMFGEAHLLMIPDIGILGNLADKLKAMEAEIASIKSELASLKSLSPVSMLQNLAENNLVDYGKEVFPQDGLTFDIGIDANFGMELDFVNDVYHSDMEVFLNSPGNIISGVGEKGRAGWAVFHSSPETWYLKAGTPTDRLGLRLGVGDFSLKATSYFMLGDEIEDTPPPPTYVAEILNKKGEEVDYMRDLNALSDGSGFAFGMDLAMETGDLNFLIFYANFKAGLGMDIMLRDYGSTACKGSGVIGIDGWYANGQAYAYLEGELGLNLKLLFVKKKIPIIKAGSALLLQAKLPNPAWFKGYLGGYYEILGGAIKGRYDFEVELGEECEIEDGSALEGLDIISDITPGDAASDIDPFTVPQVTFNMEVDKAFKLDEVSGESSKSYQISLNKFQILEGEKEIEGTIEWDDSHHILNFTSFDILPPNTSLELYVEVIFKEQIGGVWETVMFEGKPTSQNRKVSFTTGDAPTTIPLSNIKYCYPVLDNKFHYKGESSSGYVALKRGQPYLFSPETDWTQTGVFESDSSSEESEVSYNSEDRVVEFNIPDLSNSKEYSFSIVSNPPIESTISEGNEESSTKSVLESEGEGENSVEIISIAAESLVKEGAESTLLEYSFSTSSYNQFKDKLDAKAVTSSFPVIVTDLTHNLQATVASSEMFGLVELMGNEYTDSKPLIEVEAALDDDYYRYIIEPLIYNGYPLEPKFTFDRDVTELGVVPKRGIDIATWYPLYLENGVYKSRLETRMPYKYSMPVYYAEDFYDIQLKMVDAYLRDTKTNAESITKYKDIINAIFPVIRAGDYNINIQYMLPDGSKGSSGVFKYYTN